jgi:hypothetical protein
MGIDIGAIQHSGLEDAGSSRLDPLRSTFVPGVAGQPDRYARHRKHNEVVCGVVCAAGSEASCGEGVARKGSHCDQNSGDGNTFRKAAVRQSGDRIVVELSEADLGDGVIWLRMVL